MGFIRSKKKVRNPSRGSPVLYMDLHGDAHAALVKAARKINGRISTLLVYVGESGHVLTAYGVPQGKPKKGEIRRRADYWE